MTFFSFTNATKLIIAGGLVGLAQTVSVAQPIGNGMTPADSSRSRGERACSGDARRLCRAVLDQGDMTVLSCLQTNEKKLGSSCRKFLREQGQL